MKQRIKKWLAITACSLSLSGVGLSGVAQAESNDELLTLQKQWAQIQYGQSEDKGDAFAALEEQATALVDKYPQSAEYFAWRGIIRSTRAGVEGGLGALSLVKEARIDFERSIELDKTALDGSALTSLGTLYYQVPGWPLAFGDDDKARELLERGLAENPRSIDANYFYGDFLMQQGEYGRALEVLETALQAPNRIDRPLADKGRRQEISQLIEALKAEL
ncbi:tetratricopeptide repeat protein [Endozoicomonadaceae bacterium StTr2]